MKANANRMYQTLKVNSIKNWVHTSQVLLFTTHFKYYFSLKSSIKYVKIMQNRPKKYLKNVEQLFERELWQFFFN